MSDDIHALSGAYAVDALDDIERAQFEQHLAACGTCQSEVASLTEAAALLADTTVMAPSGQLRERVLAGVATVRPLPPLVALGTHRAELPVRLKRIDDDRATVTALAPRRRRRASSFLAAAAAAAVVAVGTGGVVWHSVSDDDPPASVAAQVMTAPDHETFTKTLSNGATATIYRSQTLNEAVLVTRNMPTAPTHKQYVLWLQHNGTLVPAGVLPSRADNTVVLSGDAATATAAGITQEQAGSEPSTPGGKLVGTIGFQET